MVYKIKIQEDFGPLDSYFTILKKDKYLKNIDKQNYRFSCFSGLTFGFILWSLLISAFIIALVGTIGLKKKDSDGKMDISTKYILMTILGWIFFGFIYLLGFLRTFFTSIYGSLKSLRNFESDSIHSYIEKVKRIEVEIVVECECYHMETTSTTNSDGSSSSYTQRVTTFRESQIIPVQSYTDLTNPLTVTNLSSKDYSFIDVYFKREWIPADDETSYIIQNVVNELTLKNEKKDSSFEIFVKVNYLYFKPQNNVLFAIESTKIPTLFHHGFYPISSLLLLSYPFELYFASKTCKSKFTFIKSVKAVNPLQQIPIYPIQNPEVEYQLPILQNQPQLLNSKFEFDSKP
ncbi:hypothetical protein DLAC_08522 [Tieghemostelium lacteum]|uniref:Transmembrane protein n=1 Tax=Tieghemostelium lacteum TaxID=361077 RepID=A0A151Z7L6_TIELA|nr:hypothetical protein DLAC_08522 [Tieghemostelium lacteum]|eukprot:KYQ89951.1 hypothetical protein DLAC_08522 [Tieghemostelium lacteum]